MYQKIKVDKANKDAPKPVEGSDLFVTVFTDGSLCHETRAWGIGVWIKCKEYEKPHTFTRGGIGMKNIEDVEYEGIKVALEHLEELDLTGRILVIQCDNIGALNRLDQLRIKMKHKLQHIKLKHVKAHTNGKTKRTGVNAIVDELAGKRMRSWRTKAYNEAYQAASSQTK